MNHYYHIDSKDDVTDSSLMSEKIERDIKAFLSIEGNQIKIIPFGVSALGPKGNTHYRTTKAT